MASSQGTRIAIQVVLGIVIVVLAYFLYLSITGPWEGIEREEEMTELTRARMDDIRTALIDYELETGSFPGTLDSLRAFIDTSLSSNVDSIFGDEITIDSIFYSPRGGQFDYAVNDTAQVPIYVLRDPASEDSIGALEPDPTLVNVASWE